MLALLISLKTLPSNSNGIDRKLSKFWGGLWICICLWILRFSKENWQCVIGVLSYLLWLKWLECQSYIFLATWIASIFWLLPYCNPLHRKQFSICTILLHLQWNNEPTDQDSMCLSLLRLPYKNSTDWIT